MSDAKVIAEQPPQQVERVARFSNNFGALRLLFAYLVILSHSPEILDGNPSREILVRIFGTMTFGGLAVHSFFIISGYLVTKSFINSKSSIDYLLKRVIRIYPGYVVAFLLCVFLIGPAVGGKFEGHLAPPFLKLAKDLLFLQPPNMPGVFEGSYYPALNGSMWTLFFEFCCYLVVMVLGVSGLLLRKRALLLSTAVLLMLTAWVNVSGFSGNHYFTGNFILLMSPFSCGALFYLYRDRVVSLGKICLACRNLLDWPDVLSRLGGSIVFDAGSLFDFLVFFQRQIRKDRSDRPNFRYILRSLSLRLAGAETNRSGNTRNFALDFDRPRQRRRRTLGFDELVLR